MTEQEKSTEDLIFNAAREEFIEKGFDGARMQEIAKRASINKALLHYYFRTKEKLFDAIFDKVFKIFMPKVLDVMQSDAPLFTKIEVFIESYIRLIMENPHIPSFILHELNRNPDRLVGLFGNVAGIVKEKGFSRFSEAVNEEIKKGTIVPIQPEQLIVNIIGLCIFPFIGRPIIQGVIFNGDKLQYDNFLESRKKEVTKFIINAIAVK